MKIVKWGLLILALGLGIVQFIRPEKNISKEQSRSGVAENFVVPPPVQSTLQRSCYDCHSNNTAYPWYAEVQPVGWWLNKHIRDGKRGVNFDEYGSYRLMKQYHRFNDIVEQIQKDEMPLPSYLLLHPHAKLTASEKDELVKWCEAMRDSMKAKFPIDSLERKPRR